jgi:choline dehydrogenase
MTRMARRFVVWSNEMQEADFIVVGSGSAGLALACRLSEDGRHRVVVIEHGGSDIGPLIQMPAALSYPMRMARYDWGFLSEPEPHLGGRRLACPRGKVLGGSSSINGMVFVRGHPADFDHWAEDGAHGWSFADVHPYFQRLETSHGGEEGWRGRAGPVHVTRGALANPLFKAFIEAGREAGFAVSDDTNGARQEGFGALERTIWQGRRWSAANAYLRPALRRSNVALVQALARRVVFEGRRARGVEIGRRGRVEVIAARRAVVIAASAINSPKLLMLSGIGPGTELSRLGIPVVADRPGVGANLQDHLEVYVQYACRTPVTLNGRLGLLSKARIGLQWLLTAGGEGASNHFEAGAFVRSAPGIAYPDIQMHFVPAAVRYDGGKAHPGHGFQIHTGPMRSRSRGRVTLRSPDPEAAPEIRFNYMSHEADWVEFRRAIRLAREIVAQRAFEPHRGEELAPGPAVRTDAEIDAFVRAHAESAFHPCGTCRIGRADDPEAVVAPDCRVIGVEGLAVADTSILPQITNGNLNAPAMMVGEKAADHLLGRKLLPRSNLVAWTSPNWRTSDR